MGKISVPVSMEQSDVDFVNRVGVGENFSSKVRDIFKRAADVIDRLVVYEGTVLKYNNPSASIIYEQNEEGEKIWSNIPFEYAKKDGWQGLASAAWSHGMICQVVEVKESGFVAVWIAPPADKRDCTSCMEKIKNAIFN